MIKQQMSLVLEDTAINLSEQPEEFQFDAQELSALNASLTSLDFEDVRVVSIESARIYHEIDNDQDGKWIATVSVALIVEADPSFFSDLSWFGDIPEVAHLQEGVLDQIATRRPYDFTGSWYLREMAPLLEHGDDPVGLSM